MKDAEISLAVAKVMYPEYKWNSDGEGHGRVFGSNESNIRFFRCKDKDCAWDMMVWLAERVDGGTWLTLGELLQMKNSPYEEIAMSIIEVGRE